LNFRTRPPATLRRQPDARPRTIHAGSRGKDPHGLRIGL